MSMISRETGITHAGYLDNIDIRSPDQFRKRGCFLMSGGTENTVGKRIRQKRKELGLSQEELAERMNVTAALISNYENDKVDIKTSVMRELAGILGTSVAYLMDGAPEIASDIMNLIRIYITLGKPNVRKVALEQMRILNGI